MNTMAIPERVFLLYQIIRKKGSMQSKDLQSMFVPDLTVKSDYFGSVRECALELKLIHISNDRISLNPDIPSLETIQEFRKYVNSILSQFSEGYFYRVTQAVLQVDVSDLLQVKTTASWVEKMKEWTGLKDEIDTKQINAWRFWFSFLGFGIVYDKNLSVFPNPAPFIEDLIIDSDLKEKQSYSITEMMNQFGSKGEILFGASTHSQFGQVASLGLRSLHDQKLIKLSHLPDSEENWTLASLPAHPLGNVINRVEIEREEQI